ncbi:P-loop containing nucleoside triphosphate hydrolase protein [Helicostylum pulchrum]|nr:P-loop containing nucleoside triphosphate hydrolase protein [Helicostylum pulchrum]
MKDSQSQMAAIQVAIRIRPLTERDRSQPRYSGDVLRAQEKHVQIVPQNKYFTYDHVFGNDTYQSDIFAALGQRPVQKFVEGYNVTMLAYGQTSSGKTYTMGTAQHTGLPDPEQIGIVPRAMALLFDLLHQLQQQNDSSSASSSVNNDNTARNQRTLRPVSQVHHQPQQKSTYRYSVKVSFVEIYNEELIDLLNSAPPSEKPPVNIREDTKGHIYWTGVKELTVNNTDDVLCFLQQGTENRATGSTDMNDVSSRSHAIFSVTLKQERWVPSSPTSSRAASPVPSKLQQSKQQRLSAATKGPNNNSNNPSEDGDWVITNSKFHFVDLAGSERLKRTAAEGDRRKEGININAGLLALGNVISALGDPSKKSTHVPYRDSKLTRLLQDSLGGSAMTLMIACVSPAESNLSETLNTLQYANRARNIKNKMEKNEMEEWMTTDNMDLLRTTIGKLKNELRLAKTTAATSNNTPTKMNMMLENNNQHTNNRLLSDFSDDISSTGSPTANPDFDDLYHEQHVMIAELQTQVEELQGVGDFLRERNVLVEKELVRMHHERNNNNPSDFDFQHLVEPVIEEYEKSISGLESQLAMIRAALSHSDQGFEEQQAKIDQCEIVIDSQEKTIRELKRQIVKLLERQEKDEAYVTELEKKLMTTVEEMVHDREMMSELRSKILKLKEVDENTEHYIHDLEARLTASEAERTALKEKLSTLVETSKEEITENKEEKEIADQELTTLHEKHESGEKERQRLQDQVNQLLLEIKKNQTDQEEESTIVAVAASLDEKKNGDKDQRLAELEISFANLNQEHQDTLKELDEVLLRYQEALEHADGLQPLQQKSESAEELQLLRESIQHLEYELEMSSKRENIFRQMSEEHQESAEVEKTLKTLEISNSDDLPQDAINQADHEFILHSLDVLQKKYQQLKTEVGLQQAIEMHDEGESDQYALKGSATMIDIHGKYEMQLLFYKRELKNLTVVLKEIKRLKASEAKYAAAANNNNVNSNPEHRIIMKSVVSLEEQLTEQYKKIKVEAKRFSNDILEMISLNSGLESELGIMKAKECSPMNSPDSMMSPNTIDHGNSIHSGMHSNNSSVTSSPSIRNSFLRPPTNFSNGSGIKPPTVISHEEVPETTPLSGPDLAFQYDKNRHALQARLSIAHQDLKAHKTLIFVLENKYKITEIALNTCKKRMEGNATSVTDIEIEDLMLKMDAMQIQLETNEKKERKSLSDV